MGNLYQHNYTWLKVTGVMYLVALIAIFFLSGMDMSSFTEPGFYIMTLIFVFFGLLIGFFLNLITRYRWTIPTYIAGHLLLLIGLLLTAKIYHYFDDEPELRTDYAESTKELREFVEPYVGAKYLDASEKVLYDMEQKYPLGAYQWHIMTSEYVGGDTSGNSGSFFYFVFTLPEEGENKYISKYFVKGDSLSEIYGKKDTTSLEYWQFKRNNAQYDTLFTP